MLDALGHHALGFDHLYEDDGRYVVSTAPTAPRATAALLFLNDRCGQEVELYVMTRPDSAIVVSALGTLQHWRQGDDAAKSRSFPQDHWHGAYSVGDTGFNVTSLTEVKLDYDGEGKPWSYSFPLADGVDLLIVWQPDSFGAGDP